MKTFYRFKTKLGHRDFLTEQEGLSIYPDQTCEVVQKEDVAPEPYVYEPTDAEIKKRALEKKLTKKDLDDARAELKKEKEK